MSLEDELEVIQARKRGIRQEHYDLSVENEKLDKRMLVLVIGIFQGQAKALLSPFKWRLDFVGTNFYKLSAVDSGGDYGNLQDELAKAIHIGHRGSLDLPQNINVSLHDERTEIQFNDAGVMRSYIDKHELDVDMSLLTKEVKKAEKRADYAVLQASELGALLRRFEA